ncbi:MAG TPA: hypothetical protein VF458_07465 [Ktedonobacteraceae bacterium]
MDITVAYFHALLHPEVLKHDFEQIRSTGASSLVYAIHEQEEQRGPRDFERGLRLARDAGLKIHLSLGRFGNLFAGPALVPSWYTFRHPQSRVLDQHGRYHEISCFNHQSFRTWLFREIEHYLTTYPISGIVLDEPRGLEVTCYCPACRALCPDVTDLARFRRRSMIEFLRELCDSIKQINTHVKITVVLHPHDIGLAEDLATIDNLDTIGCHLFWDMLQSDVRQVELWGRQVLETTRGTNLRSQLWLQNFNISERNAAAMETAFAGLLSLEPDELGCFYFWRNNADPLQVWETTRRLLKRVPRRQLHWRMYTSPSPAPRPMNITLPSRDRSPGKLSLTPVTPTSASAIQAPAGADSQSDQLSPAPLLEMSPSEPAHADQPSSSTPITPAPPVSPPESADEEKKAAELATTLPESTTETEALAQSPGETTSSQPACDEPGEPCDS